jgi:hypothetical protein
MAISVFGITHNYQTQIIKLSSIVLNTRLIILTVYLTHLYQLPPGCCRQTFNINSQLLYALSTVLVKNTTSPPPTPEKEQAILHLGI